MRIMHIQLAGPYTEGANYQENILSKYHAMMGNTVYFLGTCYSWKDGKLITVPEEKKTIEEGIVLERIKFAYIVNSFITKKLRYSKCVYDKINAFHPDFIMLHDIQSVSDIAVCKYLKKHPETSLIVDCHADLLNSATNWLSRYVLHGILWKYLAKELDKYAKVFFGVLPARVDFLKDIYKLPLEKCSLLLMGADDELVKTAIANNERTNIRNKFSIKEKDFLVMTGGKVIGYRKEAMNLFKAVVEMRHPNIKLLFFGSVDEEYEEEFYSLKKSDRFIDAGWVSSEKTYQYMAAADLMVFPGLHSVMWEQAVGMGIPCVFRKLNGFEHVDLGGNVVFINDTSVKSLVDVIETIYTNKKLYSNMKEIAVTKGMKTFSYRKIAEQCLAYKDN